MEKQESEFRLCIDKNKTFYIEDIRNWKTQRKGKYLIKTNKSKKPAEIWLFKNVCHREDGPAIKIPGDNKEFWFLNGENFSEKEWTNEMRKLKLQKLGI